MTLLLTNHDVDRAITVADLLPRVEDLLSAQALGLVSNIERQRVRVRSGHMAVIGGAVHHLDLMGFKCSARHGTVATIWVLLFSAATGQLIALVQGKRLGELRTGAASGVAAKHLALAGPVRMGILGTGSQARAQVEGLSSVREIIEVVVFSPNEDHRRAFAEEIGQGLGLQARPAESPRQAVAGKHVVICITNSAAPVLDGRWLDPGTLVIAAGNTSWDGRELDARTLERSASVIVDSKVGVQSESGELMAAVEADSLLWGQVESLGDVVGGRAPGRKSDDDVVVYKSIGMGSLDIVAANLAVEHAKRLGLGTPIEVDD